MRPIEPDALAKAALTGARRYGHNSGHTYSRRQLTAKQRKLIALLADGDAVGTDDLAKAFPDEWNSILAAHPERDQGLQRQALFENLADVASRINAYLLAGYKDPLLRAKMLPLLGGQLVAVATYFADREMGTVGAEELKDLIPVIAATEGNRRSTRARPTGENSRDTQDPKSPPAPEVPNEPPPTVEEAAPASQHDPQSIPQQSPPSEQPAATPAPEPAIQAAEPAPEVISATVNPITLRWTLHLPEGEIEADPRLRTIRAGTTIRRWPGEALPEDPENLTAQQLALLRSMLR